MLSLTDETTGQLIADRVAVAANPWSRFRGLMLKKRLRAGEGLLIRPCASIHMMFMRFPIDAVFFDSEDVVTKVAARVPRWRGLAFGGKGARAVIELPAGAAASVSAGHRLRFDQAED